MNLDQLKSWIYDFPSDDEKKEILGIYQKSEGTEISLSLFAVMLNKPCIILKEATPKENQEFWEGKKDELEKTT